MVWKFADCPQEMDFSTLMLWKYGKSTNMINKIRNYMGISKAFNTDDLKFFNSGHREML